MNKADINVKVANKNEYDAICAFTQSKRFKQSRYGYDNLPFIRVNFKSKEIDGGDEHNPDVRVVKFTDFFTRFDSFIIIDVVVGDGTYKVSNFTEKGFKVGCQNITWAQFDKIAEQRPKI